MNEKKRQPITRRSAAVTLSEEYHTLFESNERCGTRFVQTVLAHVRSYL
jgi:hypothetical protein